MTEKTRWLGKHYFHELSSLDTLDIATHVQYGQRIGLRPGDERSQMTQLRNAGRAGVLSIRQKFPITVSHYGAVKNRDISLLDFTELHQLLRGVNSLVLPQNHVYGLLNWESFVDSWGLALLHSGEPWSDYRLKLMACRGVGPKVASFIALLLYPLESDLAVVDTHIAHALALPPPSRIGPYMEAEALVREKANKLGYQGPLGIFHWAAWSWVVSDGPVDHSLLAVA